jgi:glycine dehydrogenase
MKTDSFALRHLGPRENDVTTMLDTIGVETLDQLICRNYSDGYSFKKSSKLEHVMTEYEYAKPYSVF